MSKLIPVNRSTPCPICADISGDCRRGGELILCHGFIDGDALVAGWKYIKPSKDGLWGVYVPDDGKRNGKSWQDVLDELQRKRKRESKNNPLNLDERIAQYQQLIEQLKLDDNHKRDLVARGLDAALIKKGLFRSVSPEQAVTGLSKNLPGISRDGRTIWVKQRGFLVPVFDLGGRAIAFQLRLDNATEGKYRWLKSTHSSHLPNGEMPITCCRPLMGIRQHHIGLAEGILKPYIAAQKLGSVMVGAAGGNFTSSPLQLRAYLESLSAELDTKLIVLYPDGGAITNRHIMGQYQRTIELVASWGYETKIAWWGQFSKSDRDIDELLEIDAIELITWEEFKSNPQSPISNPQSPISNSQSPITITETEWQLKFGLGEFLRQQFAKIQNPFKGFGEQPQPKVRTAKTQGKIIFSPGGRIDAYIKAMGAGYKYIYDKSAPGTGKSYDAGLATPERLGATKLWYLSAEARNPSTEPVETNYFPMPVRNDGLLEDPTRTTPLGKPYVRWPQFGEYPNLEGNCDRTPIFRELAAKNLPKIEAGDSPICLGCPLLKACQHATGDGYGFRYQRRVAMQRDRIRAHLDSLPNPEEYNLSEDIAFIEESGKSFNPVASIEVTLNDLDKSIAVLATKAPDTYQQIQAQLSNLRQLLAGEVKQPYHGWDDTSLREILGTIESDLEAIKVSILQVTQPDLSFLENDSIDLENLKGKDRKGMGKWKRLLEKETALSNKEANQEIGQSIIKNWLPLFIDILSGNIRGAMRAGFGHLHLYRRDDRAENLKAFKALVFLDATEPVEHLALKLGVSADAICVVEQETPDYTNLTIKQITGLNNCGGKTPTVTMQRRKSALKDAFLSQHGEIAFGDWKAHAEDGYWFGTLRGSNQFIGKQALCTFGTPYENLGELQTQFCVLTGKRAKLGKTSEETEPEFQSFIDAKVEAEFIQACQRLRSHLSLENQFTYLAVTDYSLEFLTEALPGAVLERLDAFNVTPEAGTDLQRTHWAITQAIQIAQTTGTRMTQQVIASSAGISCDWIKKISARFGGWDALKQGVLALLKAINSDSTPELTEEERWIASTWLPLVVQEQEIEETIGSVADLPAVYGWDKVEAILGAASLEVLSQLLGAILSGLTSSFDFGWSGLMPN